MTLEDLDWERGEIVVRGKGQRLERLPLPAEVGAALACYLRDVRPACATRRVFIRMKAPLQGLAGPVRHLLHRSARAPARRVEPRVQGGSPVAALACHRSASPRRVSERDRSTAASPTADDHTDLRQGGHCGAARHRAAVAEGCVMSKLQAALDEYLAVHRALGLQAAPGRPPAAALRRLRRSPGRCVHHHRTRIGMGDAARRCAARPVGEPPGDGASLRAVLQRDRSAHHRAAAGLASPPIPSSRPLHLSRRGDHAPARGRPAPAVRHRSAASYLRHALRPVRGHRTAGQRSRCDSTATTSISSTAC